MNTSTDPHFHRPEGGAADILCLHHFSDTAPFLDKPDAWRMCRVNDHAECCVCAWSARR